MFAVIKTGGKQYRVSDGDQLKIETVSGDAGDSVSFGEVLMIGDGDNITVGAPFLSGATVTGEIVDHTRNKKIIIFKKRRRQNSRRKNGHRQHQTVIKITGINPTA